ncbi:MAG: hypothetical protein G8345_01790 [Magnetococcales bacterium]|nr:hypothetical protein [Magnetococcales bacterium]NGZ25601.1 hypothetical protein [Magnetococcales bacterium]
MRQYCLVHEKKILYGPTHWNSRRFTQKAAGAMVSIAGRSLTVPIPVIPPSEWINIGSGLRILLVTHHIAPYDPFFQVPYPLGYRVTGTEVQRVYGIQDRTLEDLRAQSLQTARTVAYRRLQLTDWYVIRALEPGGKPVPKDILEMRATIRDRCNAIEDAILAAKTIEDIKSAGAHLWEDEEEEPEESFYPTRMDLDLEEAIL